MNEPTIGLIAALARDSSTPNRYVIGKNGSMPWHLPGDLRYFQRTTMGKVLLMGRRTFASLGNKPLAGRENLVISKTLGANSSAADSGAKFFSSAEDAVQAGLELAAKQQQPELRELMVIGGAQIYAQLLDITQRLYITWIDRAVEGDTWFPPFELEKEWKLDNELLHSELDGTQLHSCEYLKRPN